MFGMYTVPPRLVRTCDSNAYSKGGAASLSLLTPTVIPPTWLGRHEGQATSTGALL